MRFYKLFILVFAFVCKSCTVGFEDLNKDPLAINEVSPKQVLPKMINDGFHLVGGDYQRANTLYSALYCQYLANVVDYFTSDNYVFNTSWAERGLWNPYYQSNLRPLREMSVILSRHPEYDDMYQIMRIVTAATTMRLTDTFGDIPYFDAGKANVQNKYDSQKDIYYDIFSTLKDAVDLLKQNRKNQLMYEDEDLIYEGDVQKWIKFANSLCLRAAIRLSFIDPEKAKIEGEAALKEDLISSIEDNACITIPMPNTWYNPFIETAGWNEYRVSKTLVDFLMSYGTVQDPRLELMLGQTEAYARGESSVRFQGVPNGLPVTDVALPEYDKTHNSTIFGYMWGFEWNSIKNNPKAFLPGSHDVCPPLALFNYSEICFLKAEAALRGWNGAGSAKNNYEEGIRTSFEEMRLRAPSGTYVTDNDDNYITTGSVKWNDSDDFETLLKKIITQKWVSLFPNSDEAWAEFRRTGYPDLLPVVQSLEPTINPKNGEFIKKLRYVDNELTNNGINALDPNLNSGNGDGLSVRVWWDTGRYK